MKVRDSGMPDESVWKNFFNVDLILSELEVNLDIDDLVEIGSGYGTFTIPTSKIIKGNLYAFDIEQEMINLLAEKIKTESIRNIVLSNRDILKFSTGLPDNSIDYVMLFNILHHDKPMDFLDEAYRVLKTRGKIGIIHWRSDIVTPRGPNLSIRPKPNQIIQWIDQHKFSIEKYPFNLEPYHFGLIISKRKNEDRNYS